MTYRKMLSALRIGLLPAATLLVVFACVGTTAPAALDEAPPPPLSGPAPEPAESIRARSKDSSVSSPEVMPCVRPLGYSIEIRGRLVSLSESLCVVAADPGRVRIQIRDGYSWVEIDTRTGDVVDGDLYVEERRHFREFEAVAGRRLYNDTPEKPETGPAIASMRTTGITSPGPSTPRNDITPGGRLSGGALTPAATATHAPLNTASPTPAATQSPVEMTSEKTPPATQTPLVTTSVKAPAATQTPVGMASPTPVATQTPVDMTPGKTPPATPVASPAPVVAPDVSPTGSPIPDAKPTPEAVDTGPQKICDYSGTEQPVIKGNRSSSGERIFHTPDSAYYERTEIDESRGEVWFCTEEDALSAGWRPPLSRAAGSTTATPVAGEPQSININLASAVELETLPGIGEVKAQAIVDFRVLNGPFTSVEELLGVKGIGPVTLDKVRDLITIE